MDAALCVSARLVLPTLKRWHPDIVEHRPAATLQLRRPLQARRQRLVLGAVVLGRRLGRAVLDQRRGGWSRHARRAELEENAPPGHLRHNPPAVVQHAAPRAMPQFCWHFAELVALVHLGGHQLQAVALRVAAASLKAMRSPMRDVLVLPLIEGSIPSVVVHDPLATLRLRCLLQVVHLHEGQGPGVVLRLQLGQLRLRQLQGATTGAESLQRHRVAAHLGGGCGVDNQDACMEERRGAIRKLHNASTQRGWLHATG
mmetsp:Transcript_55901/g.161916  ORF Transcript_55901/g.161916 Transcript_55901/m.161916 type:complete len:257 (-) Transcript_55901:38-808(-)